MRAVKVNKRNAVKQYETPIADFLLANKKNLQANFHALPIASMTANSKEYRKYKALFGSEFFSSESTVTGKSFDSFFYPSRCIKKSQDYTAKIFGANETLFVTCGTSISNQIVIDAMISKASRVLLDRESHQSMHFAINDKKVNFDYFYSQHYCKNNETKYIFPDSFLPQIKKSVNEGKPYDFVILRASSYDGVIYNIYEIIKLISEISPETKYIVDEAWSSAFYFHKDLYKYTAGYAYEHLNQSVEIVSTQSAHKSLMALRQASFIHAYASQETVERLYRSRFKFHSTSPSYPILASMDLAKSQMYRFGEEMLEQALSDANWFKEAIFNDSRFKSLVIKKDLHRIEEISQGVCAYDPLKIHINLERFGLSGKELQEYLYDHYGIYFNRYTSKTFLLNIHIGITRKNLADLMSAISEILQKFGPRKISHVNNQDFIISYPPGIPLTIPGEKFNQDDVMLEINKKINSGINVFQVS